MNGWKKFVLGIAAAVLATAMIGAATHVLDTETHTSTREKNRLERIEAKVDELLSR